MPMCVFLFQAEDGIRARNVTGVQTCALPIFSSVSFRKSFISFFSAEVIDRVETFYRKAVEEESGEQGAIVLRSEERRVGKESRYRREQDYEAERRVMWLMRSFGIG